MQTVSLPFILSVLVGAAIGGCLRAFISERLARLAPASFPWGTLLINLVASTAIGMMAGVALPLTPDKLPPGWTFGAVGVLGGLSTVSTLSLQSVALWQSGQRQRSVAYLLITVSGGIALAGLGIALGRALSRHDAAALAMAWIT